MVLVDFPNVFMGDNDDKKLIYKLIYPDELSGLLNIAIEGLERIRENGDFSYKLTWEAARKKYFEKSDPVTAFVDKRCEFVFDKQIAKPDLYKAYKKFCSKRKIPVENNRGFGRILKNRFFGRIKERANNWTGITLTSRIK